MSSTVPPATTAEVNALVESYYGTLGAVGYAEPLHLDPADTVLVLVDVQQHLSKRAIRSSLTAAGLYHDGVEPLLDAIDADMRAALANVTAVLEKCRQVGIRAVHVGIQSYLPGAEDTGALHKAAGMLYPPGSEDAAFLPEAAPAEGEIVLVKTCSGYTLARTSTRCSETSACSTSSWPGSTPTSALVRPSVISPTSVTRSVSWKTRWPR